MRLIPLLLTLVATATASAHAQELKEITRKSGDSYNQDKEVYHVLKSNHSILQGEYKNYHNGKLFTSGFYNNGKPDSTWMEYLGDNLVAVKHFSQDNRVGIWEFYNTNGVLEMKFDFSTGELTDFRNKEKMDPVQKMTLVPDETGTLKPAVLDRSPQRIMASGEYLRFFMYSLRYPHEAIDRHEQGTVWVAITVDENGQAVDYSIFKSASPSLDQEAIRVQKMVNCSYLPGTLNGQKVKSAFIQPVTFRLRN